MSGGGDYEAPKCCGISTAALNQFPNYSRKDAYLGKELFLSLLFGIALTAIGLYLVIANSLSSILQSVDVSNPSNADIIRILATEQDAVCPCSDVQFTVSTYANFSYDPNPFCAFGTNGAVLYSLLVDGSPLLNTVYASLLTICNFGSSALDTSLNTLRGSYLSSPSALPESRLVREVNNLVSVAQTTGKSNADLIVRGTLFPPLLEGLQTSVWSSAAWPLITAETGRVCSDFSTGESIREAGAGWKVTIPIANLSAVSASSGFAETRANLTVSCTAMTTAYEYATAAQLAHGTFLSSVAADPTRRNTTFSSFTTTIRSSVDYAAYLSHCSVSSCHYTVSAKQSALTVVTVVFGLLGGLSVALRYPFLLILAVWKHCESRGSKAPAETAI